MVELKPLGSLYGKTGGNFAGQVYDDTGLAPTLRTPSGGGVQPMIVEKVGYIENGTGQHQSNTVVGCGGVSPTITTLGIGGTQQIKILEDKTVVAMRGREQAILTAKRTEYGKAIRKDYEGGNVKAQRKNIQQLEPRTDGVTNTITTVAKDNMLMETKPKYRIRRLTPKETWRLMGFADEDYEKAAAVNSGTQLYKQSGNAIVVPVLEAIFRQLNIKGVKTWNEAQDLDGER